MDELLLPFMIPVMREAMIVGVAVAIPCALLSCFMVLKGWSLMGDAVSHAILPGVVVAYLLGIPMLIGAFCAGLGCALATGWIAENSRVKRDTVLGVVFSGMFGLGIVLFTAVETTTHLDHILYGNLLGVSDQDMMIALAAAILVGLAALLKWRDLLLHSFDEAQARASGLPVNAMHYGLLIALSGTVVATLSAVGIVLAIGLLIAPGAIAFLTTRRMGQMLIVAPIVTVLSMVTGIYASFWLDSAPGPTVILVLTLVFIAAFIWRSAKTARASLGTN